MKRAVAMLAGVLAACAFAEESPAPVALTGLTLEGRIDGENIEFTLSGTAVVRERRAVLPLLGGDVAWLGGDLPRRAELQRTDSGYALTFGRRGEYPLVFRFASRPARDGEWRRTRFEVPLADTRKVSVLCDREDLEIAFPGALDVQSGKGEAGGKRVTAFLGITNAVEMGWKPEVRKLDQDLVVTCDANTILAAGVGALRSDSVLTYRIIQGGLDRLALKVPDLNVTQVRGEDIQDWRIERGTNGPRLLVTLGRRAESVYKLQVEGEVVLPQLPCTFNLPVLAPEGVIRSSGFILLGADNAIRLRLDQAAGITQVDQEAFPAVALADGQTRARPARALFSYQYAATPGTIRITADDIVPALSSDDRLVLTVGDDEATLTASFEVDVKDAPVREVVFEGEAAPGWQVTAITGRQVSEADTDVRDEGGRRTVRVPLKQAVTGALLVDLRLERALEKGAKTVALPVLRLAGAKAERGHVVLAAEEGIRLKPEGAAGLRDVHTGSAPVRVKGAQHAYRFMSADWKLSVGMDRATPSIHSEVFHLLSLGDGVAYGSVALTYHVAGAPVQEFVLVVPTDVRSLEFTGADIEGWTRDGSNCTVRLQARVMGDYTLLVTYERPILEKEGTVAVGEVQTVGTDSESGYIALASALGLTVQGPRPPPASLIEVDRHELPAAYAAPIKDPILAAYRVLRAPHAVRVGIQRYRGEQLLGQIADYVKLATQVSRDGETTTTATYYIKNASRQFLVVRLPPDVDLWSIKRVLDDDRREDVLSQRSDEGLLIPVSRPLDPNAATRIEVIYAQKHRPLGFWRTGFVPLELAVPALPDAHTAFASWTVGVPAGFAVGGWSGNLTAELTDRGGLPGVVRRAFSILGALADGPGGRRLGNAVLREFRVSRQVEFARAAKLDSSEPLRLRLRIAPRAMGRDSNPLAMLALAIPGLALALVSWRRPWLGALALTLLAAGLSQSALGRTVLGALLAAGAVWLALLLACRLLRFAWRLVSSPFRRRGPGAGDAGGEPPFEPDPEPGRAAGVAMTALLALAGLAATAAAQTNDVPPPPPPPAPIVMQSADLLVAANAAGRDVELSAGVRAAFVFEAKGPGSVLVVPRGGVLTRYELGSDDLELVGTEQGYMLRVGDDGRYQVKVEYRVPVADRSGTRSVELVIPESLRNTVGMTFAEKDLDVIAPAAVSVRMIDREAGTEAQLVFGPRRDAVVTWRPRSRRAALERTVFFAEVNTFAALQAGAIDLVNLLRYQVAQGELREFRLRIPAGMSVTALDGPGIATWSFDPARREIAAIADKPLSGNFTLKVTTQVAAGGLPYAAAVGVPEVLGATLQRGTLAVVAPESIQVRLDGIAGLDAVNAEDFAADAAAATARLAGRGRDAVSVRRAFRYHEATNVAATVHAEQVLPEIRVVEAGALSIADERIVLSTKLAIDIARSGVFAVTLDLPAEFDVESLTGKDVSHWDDPATAPGAKAPAARREVVVHFNGRVLGATAVDLVLNRSGRGIEGRVLVPRASVKDARKHTGKLTVSGERGVKLMVESQDGVDVKKASEEGIRQSDVLVFDILRPAWTLALKTQVMAPVLKPEVLHWVDLTEGMLQCRIFLSYRIENAGVKSFRLKVPMPGVTLSVTGRNVARVQETDREVGIWTIDLHNKVEDRFSLTASFQYPYNPDRKEVEIRPLQTLDTEGQRGYLVVTCGGRVQVRPKGELTALRAEDPRNIPASFGAGDLSGAILSYRTLGPGYRLDLSVVRHDSAAVLPASIEEVSLTSALAPGHEAFTRVDLSMLVGGLRFLRVKLPGADDRLLTAAVNGKHVSAWRDGELYCIPLEELDGGATTAVSFLYAGRGAGRRFGTERRYEAPSFVGLPLKDIQWDFYTCPGLRYSGFGGNLRHDATLDQAEVFDTDTYWGRNLSQRQASLQSAMGNLKKVGELSKAGKQKQARQVLELALNDSGAQEDLNEDARVQLRNLLKRQVKMGLVNRRDTLKFSKNIYDEQQLKQMQGFQEGEYTDEYVASVEKRLSVRDNGSLDAVAERLIDQQAAAAGVANAINVVLPEHGRALKFRRELQIDPADISYVTFRVSGGRVQRLALGLAAGLALLLAARWALGRAARAA